MKKINLVHITTSLGVGGAEAVLCDLVQNLDARIFQQSVIYFHHGPHVERLKDSCARLYQVKGLLFRYDPVFWFRLFRLLKRLNPDCIHSLLWSANIAARFMSSLLKVPCVNAFHNEARVQGAFRSYLDRLTAHLVTDFIAVSQTVAESISWVPASSIQVINNGIDAETIYIKGMQYKKSRYELELSDEQFIIGAVGRLVPIKRYELLLESFALINIQFPLTRLIIVGIGPEEYRLKQQALQLGIDQDVLFVQGQPYGYYPLFDCYVSTSACEGISMALLEACSFGLPCVVTDDYGQHPVIHSGFNGIVVSQANKYMVSKAIGSLIEEKETRQSMGTHAHETVLQLFRLEYMVQRYSNVFSQIASKK